MPVKCALDAPVAQLDRVPDYESGGQRFESSRVHHTPPNLNYALFLHCVEYVLWAEFPVPDSPTGPEVGRLDAPVGLHEGIFTHGALVTSVIYRYGCGHAHRAVRGGIYLTLLVGVTFPFIITIELLVYLLLALV